MDPPPLLPLQPQLQHFAEAHKFYTTMLTESMATLAGRFDPSYPFADTKLDLLSPAGKSFAVDDPIRGRDAVYGWIQGRALESLAGHCRWLEREGLALDLRARLVEMMRLILAELQQMKARNGGRLAFFMRRSGQPFELGDDGFTSDFNVEERPMGFADVFCSKGMFAAACYLGDTAARDEALAYLRAVDASIMNGSFRNDQVQLDPKNNVTPTPGKHTQGPFMIMVGAAAMRILEANEGTAETGALGLEIGLRMALHCLHKHTNCVYADKFGFPPGSCWEYIDDSGMPYSEPTTGEVPSDPGHALEFVGLAAWLVREAGRNRCLSPPPSRRAQAELVTLRSALPQLLRTNFRNGFVGKGICKGFDLQHGAATNTDCPWWSLPETIRAASSLHAMATEGGEGGGEAAAVQATRAFCDATLSACHNAFCTYFVRYDLPSGAGAGMAYQTVDGSQTSETSGMALDVIPATADADPGYHTGLSLLPVLRDFEARITAAGGCKL